MRHSLSPEEQDIFHFNWIKDKYKRKFDEDVENDLRVIETLHYHCFKKPKYIKEIKSTFTEMGILPKKSIQEQSLQRG